MKNGSSNFFRTRRDELGLTQRQIALALGITDTTVGNWETGFRIPRPQTWDRVAKVYKVPTQRIADAVIDITRATAVA